MDESFLSSINLSFQSQSNKGENIPEEPTKNPYITKDHVPELEIIDKNTIFYDKKKYDIKDYIEMINNIPNDLLDDVEIYNHCEKCKKHLNKFFCENLQANICDKCYEDCKIKKHNLINLEEMEKESNTYLLKIKAFLNNNIIPIKGVNENSIKECYFPFDEIKKNNEDILLIIEIISQEYINFCHLENIEKILRYINKFYINNYSEKKYEGFLKLIINNGNCFIVQFKNNLLNGKGIIYNKNGNIIYEGDFVNGKREGDGKFITKKGDYYIGQFKGDEFNGKGIIYGKNGNIIHEGEYINGQREGNGKINCSKWQLLYKSI